VPKLLFARLYTEVIELREPNAPTEGGQFDMEVMIDTDVLRRDPSPRTYFFREIGIHLAQAVSDTGVPHEHWWAEFEPIARREWNLPERQKLKI
jgi:hypothetical protein